jgi:NAD(P)-dependent dehydrogenase (short-subunit alcohol dehydrogenase family)
VADDSTEPRVVLITGGGSGIGRATAQRLATDGWRVALLGRTQATLNETASTLPESASPLVLVTDLADHDACRDAIERIIAHFGRLDAIVNNAGIAPQVPIAETDAALVRNVLDRNLVGPIVLVTTAWPELTARRGRVVNVSSMASIDPFPGFTAYAASKSGLDSLTRSIMAEAGETGVTAFTINPGVVETPLLRRLFDESVVPKDVALPPERIADEIAACLRGDRDERAGQPFPMLPE